MEQQNIIRVQRKFYSRQFHEGSGEKVSKGIGI
jgi:hypothetical protein